MHKLCLLLILSLEITYGYHATLELGITTVDYGGESEVDGGIAVTKGLNPGLGTNTTNGDTKDLEFTTEEMKLGNVHSSGFQYAGLYEQCVNSNDCKGSTECISGICICRLPFIVKESPEICYKPTSSPGGISKCFYDSHCAYEGGECQSGVCRCSNAYVHIQGYSFCHKKLPLFYTCSHTKQCVLNECSVANCTCYNGVCHRDSPKYERQDNGMTQVVLVIIGCVGVTSLICIVTIIYRRYVSSFQQARASRLQRTNATNRNNRIVSLEDGNRITSYDTPPRYEEVVVDEPKDPEPPSYTEYLEHQRTSVQLASTPALSFIQVEEFDNAAFVRL